MISSEDWLSRRQAVMLVFMLAPSRREPTFLELRWIVLIYPVSNPAHLPWKAAWMTLNANDQPLSVTVLDGEVILTGPRVAVALRPEAAAETARRLEEAADLASIQAGNSDVDGSASNDR